MMAKAFQNMLEQYGLTQKILVVNADNVTANDMQTTKRAALDNSFEEANHVQCFNHTLQLSTKALLASFNTAISQAAAWDNEMPEDDGDELILEDNIYDDNDNDNNSEEDVNEEDEEDGIDELEDMSDAEWESVLDSTAEVCETVTKVHLAFSFIIHYWLLANLTDPTAHICNHSFNNNCPPCMAMYLLKIQPQEEAYPPWCGNLMELNLRHDAFCIHIQTCNWQHHCW